MMTREEYMKIFNYEELNAIDGNQIIEDLEVIFGNTDLGCKAYLVFRNQIMNYIKNNPQKFHPTTEGKNLAKAINKIKKVKLI